MTSLQRDPNRYCATVYMPIPLGEKIITEIEGEMVERKTRACIHGKKRRKSAKMGKGHLGKEPR